VEIVATKTTYVKEKPSSGLCNLALIFFFFLMGLGFKLRASHLLSRHSYHLILHQPLIISIMVIEQVVVLVLSKCLLNGDSPSLTKRSGLFLTYCLFTAPKPKRCRIIKQNPR
jgi:hypothetical protein